MDARCRTKKVLSTRTLTFYLAGVERIELPSAVLETVILPLYYTPSFSAFLYYHRLKNMATKILFFLS